MLSKYKLRKIQDNQNRAFDHATTEHLVAGFNWYPKANIVVSEFSRTYNYPVETVTSVLSALSPRNKWERNIQDTETVLKAVRDGRGPEDVSVATFHSNKHKAFDIAKGAKQIRYTSPKTFAFVRNIAYLDTQYVTIDVWHLRASFDGMHQIRLNLTTYKQIQEVTLENAHSHGIKGFEYQAIIWNVVRN